MIPVSGRCENAMEIKVVHNQQLTLLLIMDFLKYEAVHVVPHLVLCHRGRSLTPVERALMTQNKHTNGADTVVHHLIFTVSAAVHKISHP